MTTQQLSQLYYLRREIETDEERLEKLTSAAMSVTQNFGGVGGRGSRTSDKTAIAGEIADLKRKIRRKRARCIRELNRIEEYVESIDDSMIRQIVHFRHAECLTWAQVANRIGGGNTPDGVRKMYARYMESRK